MMGRLESAWRRLRQWSSRSHWLMRLLRLPVSDAAPSQPGIVLIQIDGLSLRQLQRALARREMPFLQRLLEREHYRMHALYAGVPASTAAFQGELFYGVKQIVPAFGFLHRASGQLVRMIEARAVADIERELERRGEEPLLAGGSAYADNFRGGAAESHFCPTATGWGSALREAPLAAVLLLCLTNAYSFVRALALLALELCLAVVDCLRGLVAGQDLVRELLFIPTRVLITILLRELVTIGAKIDVARGLSIVHLNFLGYDEQAHRRGPSSAFAHWSLKGIDDAIARLWRAAHRATRRRYEVWIYSDHGQERAVPYQKMHGRDFAEAVATVFADRIGEPISYRTTGSWGVQLRRVALLGGRRTQRWAAPRLPERSANHVPELSVATMGPVAMIYWARPLGLAERASLAAELVARAGAPLVLTTRDDGTVHGWLNDGEIELPRDALRVLGEDHPFATQAAHDLVELCRHPDAGDLIVYGAPTGGTAVSFALENGSHGGAGAEESQAFVLLPENVALEPVDGSAARAADLRRAVQCALGSRAAAPRDIYGSGRSASS